MSNKLDLAAQPVSSLDLLNATLDSSADGIFASTLSGEVICMNLRCAEMWRFPENFREFDSAWLRAHILTQMRDPDKHKRAMKALYANPERPGFSIMHMKDGRVVERHTRPIYSEGECIGLVSNYRDTTEQLRAQAELDTIHAQLIDASRQAGKAEIATNVLHNVGNVLNSVNVSATLVRERITNSKISGLTKAVALLHEHEHELGDYLCSDPQGKSLLAYLTQLSAQFEADRDATLHEVKSLNENIEHIKEIVAMQQTYARGTNTTEAVNLENVLEEALRVNEVSLVRHDLEVVRDIAQVPPVQIDKHQALQILVNLLGNAKQACLASTQARKVITLALASENGWIRITVSDNGVGIAPENLTKIFNHGFTTRKDGHGFGLHSAALTAKQMGGSLSAESAGPGKGAAFILELPIDASEIAS